MTNIIEYKAHIFETIFDLKNFLNANNIPPQNIITILSLNSANGYCRLILLYFIRY